MSQLLTELNLGSCRSPATPRKMKRVRNVLIDLRGGIREPDPEEVKLLNLAC